MLDSIINKMKLNRLSYNEEYDIKELLETIKKHIETNIDLLQEGYQYENNDSLDTQRLINAFNYDPNNKTGIIDAPFKNDYGKVANNYVPYGVVGFVVKKDLSLYNYASILSLLIQTNNSVIIEPYKEIGTVNILIELLNQVITQINGINKIIINSTNESLSQNNNLDLLLFIGSKTIFNDIKTKCIKKYYGIGNYELIIDKVLDNKLIEEAKKRNVTIINKDDNNFYNRFNQISSNYCTGFMSDDKNEIRNFIANVKSSYLMVNVLPTIQDEINVNIEDLVYKKSTLIWEDKTS